MKAKQRIALFGGTFDPIHLGHTEVIDHAASRLAAETVIFIPARRSPLKNALPQATDADRVAMIELAITDHPGWKVSDCELQRPAPSFTIDTLLHFKARYGGDATIYWMIGADAIPELPHWHRIDQLMDHCQIVAMVRAGCPKPDFTPFTPRWGQKRIRTLQEHVIETPQVDVSSTGVRQRLAKGQDVSSMLHPAVLDYIQNHGLYQGA
jgi:nicotinate-nucleotide adenylyltransferase